MLLCKCTCIGCKCHCIPAAAVSCVIVNSWLLIINVTFFLQKIYYAPASIISESVISITVLCLLCSPCYTAVQIKSCSKSTSVITVAIRWCHAPVIIWNWSIHFPSLSVCLTRYTAVEIKKSTSVIKVATIRNMYVFSLRIGSHHVQPPN